MLTPCGILPRSIVGRLSLLSTAKDMEAHKEASAITATATLKPIFANVLTSLIFNFFLHPPSQSPRNRAGASADCLPAASRQQTKNPDLSRTGSLETFAKDTAFSFGNWLPFPAFVVGN